MSPLFLKLFAKEHQCSACSSPKAGARKFCALHLQLAREKWSTWATERRLQGTCAYCDNKSFRGFLRCRLHTLQNRAKVREWHEARPAYQKETWATRKAFYAAQGRCVYCKDHRPAVPGLLKCQPCRDSERALRRGERKPFEGTYVGSLQALTGTAVES
jgi:hypothetical protein